MDHSHTYRFADYTLCISALKSLYHFMIQLKDELTSAELGIVLSAYKEEYILTTTIVDNKTKELVAFAVCHKVDYDPYNNHNIPSCLDFIYVIKTHRNKGLGLKVLKFLIYSKLELTAFVTDKSKQKFFKKAGFKLMGVVNKCYAMQSPKINHSN